MSMDGFQERITVFKKCNAESLSTKHAIYATKSFITRNKRKSPKSVKS